MNKLDRKCFIFSRKTIANDVETEIQRLRAIEVEDITESIVDKYKRQR